MSECMMSGRCDFSDICEEGNSDLVYEAILTSPEIEYLVPEIGEDQIKGLIMPVIVAWNSEPCLKEKVRSLKGLQFDRDISHLSITMGSSVLAKIDEMLGVS
ncbi:MAG: hypothetical protein ACXWLH_00160 [Candidatus Saccharimonadales bacterium]